MQRCEKAERDLAACYRLSGADPNGNEDWRLAPGAIDAVEELRKDYDRTCSELERVERELDEAWRVLQAARPFAAQWTPLNYTQLANRKQALVEAFRIYDAVCAAAGGGLVDPLVAERERLAAGKAKGGRGEGEQPPFQ